MTERQAKIKDVCERTIAGIEEQISTGRLKNWCSCFCFARGAMEGAGLDGVPFEIINWLDAAVDDGRIRPFNYY